MPCTSAAACRLASRAGLVLAAPDLMPSGRMGSGRVLDMRLCPAQQGERVGNEIEHGGERGNGSLRTAWKVDDKGASSRACHRSAERGKRGLLPAGAAHPFAEAVEHPVTDGAGGLRGDVPGRNPGATGSDDQRKVV